MTTNSPEQSIPIDHPVQPGWLAAGLDIVAIPKATELVPETFERFGEDARRVMHALVVASRRTDSARDTHERANVAKMLLSDEELAEYRQLAGKPETALEYLKWFGRKASDVYTFLADPQNFAEHAQRLNHGKKLGKIALELFGQRQAGQWNTTQVDALARTIPQLLAQEESATVEVYDDPEHPKLLSYQFIRLKHIDGALDNKFEFGTIRRTRMLADVALTSPDQPSKVVVQLFKESTGVVVMKNLTDADRRFILLDHLKNEDNAAQKGSASATRAGAIFELAIRNKETTTTVVPMTIKDIMLVRAPNNFPYPLG